jgi:uncharacterized Rmd1/YagE family protein
LADFLVGVIANRFLTMSFLWNRMAMGRSNVVRSLLQTRPSVVRQGPVSASRAFALPSPLLELHKNIAVAHYHSYSQSPSSVDSTIRKIRRLDKRASVDTEAAKQVLSPQQEALQKLGIVNDKLKSRSAVLSDNTREPNKEQEPPPAIHVPVRSVHAAQTLDVVKVLQKVFISPVRHYFGKTSLIVQLKPPSPGEPFRFVAVYRFGSVVFFNITSTQEIGKLLESIKMYGKNPIASGFERRENFGVVIQPRLEQLELDDDEVVTGDYCVVESLDLNSVSVVANIMAQTVALDSYNDVAEELLSTFADINSDVRRTGKFTEMQKDSLFRVVAQNNAIFIDMISKLGIKERSDTAWNLTRYTQVHEEMKEEFEIDHRFDNIEFKLDMIQQNAKFFLEMLHSQKTNTLEWIIIVLILFECILMCLEMSGLGTPLFESVAEILPETKPSSSAKPA